ncbi:hypothetical protein FSP39_002275 [Pinctada imbricata]|uniref:Galaxin-like repeats domain-containing protein n=1 Tax=Pinctada imbricata TaxID=66713 RepID=A0AA89BR38_PINIB|nr:hypothetical protein FSP39_002275 [Pinctada imbricata]
MYNNNIKKCCQNYNGTIGKLASLSEECCGSTPFNSSTHFCYEKERPVKLFFDICGSKEYDTRDFICCGTTLHTKQKHHDLNCCGSGLYDNRIEQCCRTSEIPFTADKDAFCCGKSSYNYKIQRCCHGIVFNASATQECCNNKLFDTRYEGCCARILFNQSTHKCCGFNNITSKNNTCCGNSGIFFSPVKEVCCGDRYTIPKSKPEDTKCCLLSNTSYNELVEKCGPARCGMVPYNPKTDLCCGGRKVHRNGVPDGKKCCNPGILMFDPKTEICCSSNVVKKESNRTNCRNYKKGTSPVYDVTTKPFEHSNICGLCQLNSRGFMASLKNGRINVCQKNIFRVKISRVWRVKNIRKRIKYSKIRVRLGKKISLTKSKDARRRRRKVNLELLCECSEIRADMRFILLTNSDTDQGDIRLGDSDVIMPDIHEFHKVMKAKLRKCPAVVQRKLTKILQNT